MQKIPQQTLDERFRDGPPTRGPNEMRRWMNAEEKRFVLWGLKEEWSSSRIAQALGVNEATVRRLRAKFVREPNTLIDLNVSETVESPSGVSSRCLVCSDSVGSIDGVDRHVLAHFLDGADLESAIAARLAASDEVVSSRRASDADSGQLTFLEQQHPGPEPLPVTDTGPLVPGDADRAEVLQALRRLAALPDNPVSDRDASPPQAEARSPDNDLPEIPPRQAIDVSTDDIHDAFERLAGRRGLLENGPRITPGPAAGDKLLAEVTQLREEVALEGVSDTTEEESIADEEASPGDGIERATVAERPRPVAAAAVDHVKRWARTASEGLQKRDIFGGLGSAREATSVTIESGTMKILSTRGLDVVDYRVVPLSPQLYTGGVVADAVTMSRHLLAALDDMNGTHRRLYAAVPGYQSTMRRLDLPDVRELDPKVIVPREARRALGVTAENSTLRWQRLPGRSRVARWLVAAASDTSYSAISAVIQGTGHKLRALELRPFALTRAVGQPSVLCVSTSPDGCEAVVVRDWVPHTYQSVYWEAGSVADTADLAQRVTEVLENTIDLHNLHNPEVSLPMDVPVVVTGGEVERHAGLGALVASNAGRTLVEGINPLHAPDDFPYHSMVVNVGLVLWDA